MNKSLPVLSDYNKRIQESFTSPEKEQDILVGKIKNQLKDNLTKGLIDEDTFKKAEEQLDNLVKAKKGEGTRGGHVIGHTKSGKPVYADKQADHKDYKKFSAQDHIDASDLHNEKSKNHGRLAGAAMSHESQSNHQSLQAYHSSAGSGHAVIAHEQISDEHHEGLSKDEKKILKDNKKKQIEHHQKGHDFHSEMVKHIEKKVGPLDIPHPSQKEAHEYHKNRAEYHKQEKENLEKKGY